MSTHSLLNTFAIFGLVITMILAWTYLSSVGKEIDEIKFELGIRARPHTRGSVNSDYQEVTLYPSRFGDKLRVSHEPPWFKKAMDAGMIITVDGTGIDDSTWTHLKVLLVSGPEICSPGEVIGKSPRDGLYINHIQEG